MLKLIVCRDTFLSLSGLVTAISGVARFAVPGLLTAISGVARFAVPGLLTTYYSTDRCLDAVPDPTN